MPFFYLPLFILLLSTFSFLRNRSTRSAQKKQESFLEKEQRANLTRKQDISGLAYIHLPMQTFPIGKFADEKLAHAESELALLSDRQILNLTGITNTDLKLQYGAANLAFLSDCDANYTRLARAIVSYGKRLAELGHAPEAITVLEFGVSCKTDISANYTLLASLYRENGEIHKVQGLIETVKGMDMFRKESILKQLETIALP